MQLVYLENGKEAPYTLSSIVAECAEVQHHTVTRLIRKRQSSLNKFGKVGFKIQASESGQKEKDYKLRERENARKSTPALDLMTGDELARYRELATLVIMYLNQGLTYQEIKNQVM
ncbi:MULTISPECIES: hypothetical protein [Aerococcus]|uniref:Uncharacterized protein n=1 Tax=Aerococcus sanguinicola TaxID=119206 RepID=A0A5N1GLS6_9LACT|nr:MULTISPECIES: hypothetical protein [Aerococcus]KAA9301937.1 hypothetical protein F6I03_01650 [Aerococcus sanguinicola]MDK6368639.1 hypothetical protein [Aerococcus sp. UMB9870]MDK6679722.1 hypothetical protein [Aerococcus sp. UMB8608]MDK6686006.1 hypothetical protein [Aerococcus sp. UMB8623]MDK6940812.1 hypothetical protein [Aerococcus sp. UMB8487]